MLQMKKFANVQIQIVQTLRQAIKETMQEKILTNAYMWTVKMKGLMMYNNYVFRFAFLKDIFVNLLHQEVFIYFQ